MYIDKRWLSCPWRGERDTSENQKQKTYMYAAWMASRRRRKEEVGFLLINADCEDSPMTNESYTKRRTETKEDKIWLFGWKINWKTTHYERGRTFTVTGIPEQYAHGEKHNIPTHTQAQRHTGRRQRTHSQRKENTERTSRRQVTRICQLFLRHT